MENLEIGRDELGVPETLDENLARIRAHRNNIHRYRKLLGTKLSELEHQFIDRRLAEERTALEALASKTFPMVFTLPESTTPP